MGNFLTEIRKIFIRDIQKVIDEISGYKNDADLWILPSGINNSAGTLALHLAGNLQHFIGAVLGNSGYVRNRDNEFAARNISQADLILELNKALTIVDKTLSSLPEDKVNETFPHPFYKEAVSNCFILLHLVSHLDYHLGQINYHRRLLTDQA